MTVATAIRCKSQNADRRLLRCIGLALLAACVWFVDFGAAQADGGKLQSSERVGPWIVSLFTSPTPPVTGLVDVSVLVQRADTNEPVTDASIRIVAREEGSSFSLQTIATREAATNKLFRAAWLDLPASGQWTVTAQITADEMSVESSCDIWVSAPPPPWKDLTCWILWPCVPIALYASGQIRGGRGSRTMH